MTGSKIAAVVFGVLSLLVGAAMIAGAAALLTEDRDDDGFYISEDYTFAQSSHAIVSEDIEIVREAPGWLIDRVLDPVDLRIQGTNAGEAPLFMGVAATSDVDGYLADVAYHEVTDLKFDGSKIDDVEYRTVAGTTTPTAPGAERFWEVSVEGTGLQTLDWSLESGSWTVVVMNADATAGVDADLALGAKISNLVAIAWVVIGIGVLFGLLGMYLMYRGFRRPEFREPTRIVDLREEAEEREREPIVRS
jgi:hypothetical protein